MILRKHQKIIFSLFLTAALLVGISFPAIDTFASNPPDTVGYTITTATDDSMDVTVKIQFDENVYLSGSAESDFNVTIAGSSLSSGNLDYYVTDSTAGDRYIELVIYDASEHSSTNYGMYKMDNLTITATGTGNTLPHVKSSTYNNAAVWDLSITNKIIPSNLGMTYVSSTSNSVTYQITHKPNIRCMNWLRLKDGGSVVNCTSQTNTMSGTTMTIPAWANGSFIIHSHNFATDALSAYATAIAAAINSSGTAGIYGNYTASASGAYITITKASGSGTLSLEVYNYTLQ